MLGVDRHSSASAIKTAYRRLCIKAHPDKGGCAEHFAQLTTAYEVLCDAVRRAAYEAALADEAVNVLLETVIDEHGVEWIPLSKLRLEEKSQRQHVSDLNEEFAKALEEESMLTDGMLKKKDEQFQQKEQELHRVRQELETLASQKQLDDVKVQFEQLRAERAVAHAERQINELAASLRTQQAKHVEDVASLEQVLKSRDAERVGLLAERESLQTRVAEFTKEVAARDLAIKIQALENVQKLAASDERLALKHAEYLREIAGRDDECSSLTKQLRDLHEGTSRAQEQSSGDQAAAAAGTAQEHVSRDEYPAAGVWLQPPLPPPRPPSRIPISELTPPPPADYWARAGECWSEQWSEPAGECWSEQWSEPGYHSGW